MLPRAPPCTFRAQWCRGCRNRCMEATQDRNSEGAHALVLESAVPITQETVATSRYEIVENPIKDGHSVFTGNHEEDSAQVERHHKWINKQITCAAGQGNILWLLQVAHANLEQMNLINFSTAFHRIAKHAYGCSPNARQRLLDHASIQALQKAVVRHVAQFDGPAHLPVNSLRAYHLPQEKASEMRCLSLICWSCAILRIREESLFDRMAHISKTRLSELKPFELSNMIWAFAKLSFWSTALFDSLEIPMHRCRSQFSPQCLSTIVWAFGTAKAHNAEIFGSFASGITRKAHTMTPQGIANTAWAFARVHRQDVQLFRALAEAAICDDVIWSFKLQELSNMVWAFATVGLAHSDLFTRVAEVVLYRCIEFSPQNVANMLWAYAKLQIAARTQLFPPLLEVAIVHLGQYKPQEIAAILWAAAKEVGCPVCHNLFLAVPRVFLERLPEFTSQALACMVEAFTLANVDVLGFYEALVIESTSKIHTFEPASLCTLFRGIAIRMSSLTDTGSLAIHLQMTGQQISERLPVMQSHNIAHLQESLGLLHSSLIPASLRSMMEPNSASPIPPGNSAEAIGAPFGGSSFIAHQVSRKKQKRRAAARMRSQQISVCNGTPALSVGDAVGKNAQNGTRLMQRNQFGRTGFDAGCDHDDDEDATYLGAPDGCTFTDFEPVERCLPEDSTNRPTADLNETVRDRGAREQEDVASSVATSNAALNCPHVLAVSTPPLPHPLLAGLPAMASPPTQTHCSTGVSSTMVPSVPPFSSGSSSPQVLPHQGTPFPIAHGRYLRDFLLDGFLGHRPQNQEELEIALRQAMPTSYAD